MAFKKGHVPWTAGKSNPSAKNLPQAFKKGQHASSKTEFKKGLVPWNKGKKGLWNSPRKGKTYIEIFGATKANEIKEKIGQKLWTGGRYLTHIRQYNKRRTLGSVFLNMPFEGSEGHHIDREHVIFIPKDLHRSVWHSLDKLETMEQINTKVFCWLLGR